MTISKVREWWIYEEWLIQKELTKLKERALSHKWKKELKDKNDRESKRKTQNNDND